MTKKSNSIILIPFALVILLCFICPSIFLYHASHSSILDKNYPLSTTLYDVSKSQIVHLTFIQPITARLHLQNMIQVFHM